MIIDDKEEEGEFTVSLKESQFITSDETFICRRRTNHVHEGFGRKCQA